jgi:uncharacterized protein (TIGR03435 family)
MLQALLADRFALRFHKSSKDIDLYVLSVAKNGPKLGPAFHAVNTEEPPATGARAAGQISFPSFAMATFARFLPTYLARDLATGRAVNPMDVPPVVDKTGIEGTYDILLDPAGQLDWSSLLERQLGLKLELRKVSVETLVLDSATRPDPNQ